MDRRERIEHKLSEGLAPTHIEVVDESHLLELLEERR